MSKCSKCGSQSVICECEVFEGNLERDGIEWSHTCRECGNVETEFFEGCYGFDCEHICPIEGCGKVHYG